MKHLSISRKLIVGFGIILILMVASTLSSIIGISSVGGQMDLYSTYTVPNAEYIRGIQVSLQGILHELLEALVADNAQNAQAALDEAAVYGKSIVETLEEYKSNQLSHDRDADIEKAQTILAEAAAQRNEITRLVQTRTEANLHFALELYQTQYKPRIEQVMELLLGFSASDQGSAARQSADAKATTTLVWLALAACIAVTILVTVAVILLIRRSILTPVREIVGVYEEISKGNKQVNVTYESRDELGQMAKLIRETNQLEGAIIRDLIEKLTKISQGDLQIQVDREYPGDFIVIKQTIEATTAALNRTMHTISATAEQVSSGAAQLSSGAQELSSGASEQASSVEELSASIGIIADQAAENSANVQTAAQYVQQADEGISTGYAHMERLIQAMEHINASSAQIANITKVIEDIAFQTNILALNAAIEAASAGAAGKGFAVVADEVRSLAAKSSEAAKQTAELIQRSANAVAEGSQMTKQTEQILRDVKEQALMANESIVKIERASAEQAVAIGQIRQGLGQVSAIVQTNAATAQENSATSEELSAQAATLRGEVSRFKLKTEAAHSPARNQQAPSTLDDSELEHMEAASGSKY